MPDLTRCPRTLAGLFAMLVTCAAAEAFGLDYDRNDVLGREVAVGAVLAPVEGRPIGAFVRGTARRHTRYLYFAAEAQAGVTTHGIWLAGGGAVGGETADDAWQPLRGYGELGILALYANSRLVDALGFFIEGGMRYQVRSYERPHMLLHLGVRAVNNFSHFGYMVSSGVGWTFD